VVLPVVVAFLRTPRLRQPRGDHAMTSGGEARFASPQALLRAAELVVRDYPDATLKRNAVGNLVVVTAEDRPQPVAWVDLLSGEVGLFDYALHPGAGGGRPGESHQLGGRTASAV
jgi:hypothetical protein